MIICKSEDAGTKVCPMAVRSCAGERCMAWHSVDLGGYCGMVPSTIHVKELTAPITPMLVLTDEQEAALEESHNTHMDAQITESNAPTEVKLASMTPSQVERVEHHAKRGRPKHI